MTEIYKLKNDYASPIIKLQLFHFQFKKFQRTLNSGKENLKLRIRNCGL